MAGPDCAEAIVVSALGSIAHGRLASYSLFDLLLVGTKNGPWET